jgi:hypothetical protein
MFFNVAVGFLGVKATFAFALAVSVAGTEVVVTVPLVVKQL